MKKLKFTLLCIALMFSISLIMTGCEDSNVALISAAGYQNQETLFTEASEKETIAALNNVQAESEAGKDTDQNLVRSLDDLYKSYRSLKIQRSSESTVYDAAKPLSV